MPEIGQGKTFDRNSKKVDSLGESWDDTVYG